MVDESRRRRSPIQVSSPSLPSPVSNSSKKASAHTAVLSLKNNPSNYATILIIIGNIASSVFIVLVNKLAMTGFPFPTALTAFHQIFCWIFTYLLTSTHQLHIPTPLNTQEAVLLGTSYSLGVVFMNISLKHNSVGIYQLLKMACIPCIVLLQRILYSTHIPLETTTCLSLILTGVGLSTIRELSLNPLGMIYGSLAVATTAIGQVWLANRHSAKQYDGLQLVAVISPYTSIICILASLIFESSAIPALFTNQDVNVPYILATCLLAVAANYFGFSLIMSTGAVTYQVVGHFKTVLTLGVGMLLSGGSSGDISVLKGVGVVTSLVGMVWYSRIKTRKQKRVD
ncbi:hypothetical protein SmJEL517_g06205 [Synchytrium microbalum]|uniref:Sugar phosphate transporter domain-containing protein n=1 Tax=Synchytrium microbalum TaxID=1806994 RepID=A0A507BXT9_9FUNG|nr:uncharacterized protein SmJEL517_g06205 [Synchytrium microbalum]TPX30165.1 hypothetical protein SmJEL517_g06205 [Synchytrium microbalum]